MIKEIQKEHAIWQAYNFPETTSDLQFKGIVEELGELARADLKTEQGIRGFSKTIGTEKAQDAVGDIIIYMMGYCNQKGWDLEKIIQKTWDQVKERDWILYPNNGKTE